MAASGNELVTLNQLKQAVNSGGSSSNITMIHVGTSEVTSTSYNVLNFIVNSSGVVTKITYKAK